MGCKMSSLELLLKRIHMLPEPTTPPVFDHAEPSADLSSLINRVYTRHWLDEEIPLTRDFIKAVRRELKTIDHALECEQCLLTLQLDVERYMGTHSYWWLDMTNLDCTYEWDIEEECSDPYYEMMKDMPHADNYDIGSYWCGAKEDTIRFIKDRGKWARSISLVQLDKAKKYLRLLHKWTFNEKTVGEANSLVQWLMYASTPP